MVLPTGPAVFRDASLTLDGTEFAGWTMKARLVPDTPIQTVRTLIPDGQIQDVDSPVWTLELSGLQSISVTGTGNAGPAEYLRGLNPGTDVAVVLLVKTGVNHRKATFTVKSLPTEFGGDEGAFLPFEIALPVAGQPTFGSS